ncbi:amidohydrolase family protein [Steroidobacter sp.]|uniref:amidohydrolase family protein n=1 Tax=Steroidobacter sp. TaxID=1978227 RepID=UPI0025F49B18|nr:amidohydrolase family protein [Steroidobacter sp.]
MFNRRHIMSLLGLAGAAGVVANKPAAAAERATGNTANELIEALATVPVLDVHSHGFPALAPVTEEIFLETLALSAWMLDAYFPAEPGQDKTVYEQWRAADPDERKRLDRKYGIQKRFDEVVEQMRSTTFVEALTKEMAVFLRCKPTLKDVIAARNEYTSGNYWRYVNDMFGDAQLEGALVQGSLGAWTLPEPKQEDFKKALKMKVYDVVTAGAWRFLDEDIPVADLVSKYRAQLKKLTKEDGGVAIKSGIVKLSGADVEPVTPSQGEQAWEQWRKLSKADKQRIYDRTWRPAFWKTLQDFLLWETCAVAYELDIPLHIHAGNGEGQDKISTHYPYKLENVVRYPVEFPQKPVQIVLLHAGFPHHAEAAYMSHIFPNVWYDMSIMAPFVNRGLYQRLLETFETAPLSKVMYGSDAYHVPEFFYLGAKWAKKHVAKAMAVLVDDGVLTKDDAVRYAKMILADNARRLHKLPAR